MKNCLIVVVVLIFCAVIAVYLVLNPPGVFNANDPRVPRMIGTWTEYDDNDMRGAQISIGTDRMEIDAPARPQFKRTEVKGHWNLNAFYIDSHLDSPAEFMVAKQLKNEDLEVDVGRFISTHTEKITCVKTYRDAGDRPPYPVSDPKVQVSYPPPKGLIRVGMLECDLRTLPWQPDRVDIQPTPGQDPRSNDNEVVMLPGGPLPDENPQLYRYHSDRPDAPELLALVYHGRVTEVTGGLEDSNDVPYELPAQPAPKEETGGQSSSWRQWLVDSFFWLMGK